MLTALLIAAAILFAALAIYCLYAVLGLTVRSCAICTKPVRERQAVEWTGPSGGDLHTHYGRCAELYHRQHLHDFYRAERQP